MLLFVAELLQLSFHLVLLPLLGLLFLMLISFSVVFLLIVLLLLLLSLASCFWLCHVGV